MTATVACRRRADPSPAAIRVRERIRTLSKRAFAGEQGRRIFPLFSLTALLLAGLLVYLDLTRIAPPAPVPVDHAGHLHRK